MKLQVWSTTTPLLPLSPNYHKTTITISSSDLHNPRNHLCFSSLSLQSNHVNPTISPSPINLTSSIGFPPPSSDSYLSHWTLTNRHILMLNTIACAAAISTSWLFFSAIPTLWAFRTSAESLEKLLDVMREEVPDTMAAVRLSGMEISDLTTELSDLGQEITKGVRRSTRVVRVAEDSLRRFTAMAPADLVQKQVNSKAETGPEVAKKVRGLREGIVKGRSVLQTFFSLFHFSQKALSYFAAGGQKL